MAQGKGYREAASKIGEIVQPYLKLQSLLNEYAGVEEEIKGVANQLVKEKADLERFKTTALSEMNKIGKNDETSITQLKARGEEEKKAIKEAVALAKVDKDNILKAIEDVRREHERVRAEYKATMEAKQSETNDALDKANLELKDVLSQTKQAEAELIRIKSRVGRAQIGLAQVEAS